jgi:hypothetical protein
MLSTTVSAVRSSVARTPLPMEGNSCRPTPEATPPAAANHSKKSSSLLLLGWALPKKEKEKDSAACQTCARRAVVSTSRLNFISLSPRLWVPKGRSGAKEMDGAAKFQTLTIAVLRNRDESNSAEQRREKAET